MKHLLIIASCFILASCAGAWTSSERAIIASPAPLHVLSVDNDEELAVLRDSCARLSAAELLSKEYEELCSKMLLTVTDSSQAGVGIAAPQVGIKRRVVAVQRFDKEGEPWEVYANIGISAMRGDLIEGSEGCLSVPGKRGVVARSRDIEIQYSVVRDGAVIDTTENVVGWTAVIFQHECDHLDGVIYTDKTL